MLGGFVAFEREVGLGFEVMAGGEQIGAPAEVLDALAVGGEVRQSRGRNGAADAKFDFGALFVEEFSYEE